MPAKKSARHTAASSRRVEPVGLRATGRPAGDDGPPLLEMRGISKRFGDAYANHEVDLTLRRGEVLGLLGENGAGKTTLMNVLFGLYSPDAGTVHIGGRAVALRTPADALAAGVGMVHQHFHLVPQHTVIDNLLVGASGRYGMLNHAAARQRLADIGRRYGMRLPAGRRVAELSVGEQQRLEIVKALFRGARILILDEPTSVLTPQQSEGLFDAVRAMAGDGVGVIFISHKLREVLAITDRLTVLRRGRVVANLDNRADLDPPQLAQLMCGRELTAPARVSTETGRTLLELQQVAVAGERGRPPLLRDIDLALRAGEIVGVAGVSGSGQTALADLIAGSRSPSSGRIAVDGVALTSLSPRAMQRLGVAHIPEDRIGDGVLAALPLADSMALTRIRQRPFSRFGWLNRRAMVRFTRAQMERFDIRAAGPEVRTGTLSGGNLQKALLARELAFDPLVLVAAQPTRGLDVAAVEFVHRQFLGLRAAGRAVLLISEDLEELFQVTDRIVVMYEGGIAGNVVTADTDVAQVGLLMTGGAS